MSKIRIATRRELLKNGLGLIGVGSVLPNFLIRTALAGPAAEPQQRVMVVLQLHGGNDGMSTLVPHGHKEYHEYRKATRISENEVIKINNELGLNPILKGWKELLDEGSFAAIPGVGYPNPNFSHFTATDTWMMGDPRGRQLRHGWVGRACDVGFKDNLDPKLAVAVGIDSASPALLGRDHPGILFNRPESFGYGGAGNNDQWNLYRKLNEGGGTPPGELEWVTSTAVIANAAAEEIRRLALAYRPKAEYPDTAFGRNLRIIAGLIAGGLSTRIYWTGREGRFEFDTHGNQRPRHDTLTSELNAATTAFFKDLKLQGQAQRVLLFTISEFGRTSKENGSQGTDHAAAAAQFLLGAGLKPGIYGTHPSLKESDLLPTGNSLRFTTDFRSVYATVLEKWLRIPSAPVLGQQWPLIDCFA